MQDIAGLGALPPVQGMIRVGVVEDQPLLNGMLSDTIRSAGFQLVASVTTVQEARRIFGRLEADVILMDIELPDGNGVGLAVGLKRKHPSLGVVFFSIHDVMDILLDLPDDVKGGWGYLSKNAPVTDERLFETIRAVHAGQTTLDPRLVAQAKPRSGSAIERLSERRFQVLQLVAIGKSNAGIAARLGITEKSVQNHLTGIYAELGIDQHADSNPRVKATLVLLKETGRVE